MSGDGADRLRPIARNLRTALVLALFVEFGFVVALFALSGAFNGGRPTTTPPVAVGYLVTGFVVTIAVITRTWQMLAVAKRGDSAALRRMNIRAWVLVALVFSAILPAIYLNAAAAELA